MFRLGFFFIFFLSIVPVAVKAQNYSGPTNKSPDQRLIVGNIYITGNKITKRSIILREIEVNKGDTLTQAVLLHKLKESRQNLLNRHLFNFVNIKSVKVGLNRVNLYVSVIERWYIWPIPILKYTDPNFNVWWEKKEISHLDYGVNLKINNFRGRMETLKVLLQNGYNKSFQVSWKVPYINKKQTWGLGMKAGVTINHETDYKNQENKMVFFGKPNSYVKKNIFATILATYRPGFKKLNTFSLSFNYFNFADTLLALNTSFAYGKPEFSYLSIRYNFKLDYRDYAPYPLNGYYFELNINQFGLGILSSKVNLFSAYVVYDRYFHIHKPWYFAFDITLKAVPNRYQPYFLEKGLGFPPTTLRGYQLYIVNGQWTTLFRSNLKYDLIPKKIVQIPFIRSEKFSKLFYAVYANLIFDAGYVSNNNPNSCGPLNNKLLYGTGVGIDFVSYYDTVIRLEYTINRQNEKNFFISLVAPI